MRRGWTRGVRSRRLVRLAAVLTAVVMAAVTAMGSADASALPQATVRLSSMAGFVRSLFASPVALPGQGSGTASGRGGDVSASATRSGKGSGRPPGAGKGELPAYHPSPSKVPAGKSGTKQIGFDAKTSTRNARKSAAFSDYFNNADGSYTVKTSVTPLNYQAADGSWQPIDTTFTKRADGRWHQAANGFDVSLAPGAAAPVSGQSEHLAPGDRAAAPSPLPTPSPSTSAPAQLDRLADLTMGSGTSVAWSLTGAADVPATTSPDGHTVSYPGVLADTTLTETSESFGVAESLVLSSAHAPTSFTFPLSLTGLTLAQAGGGWNLLDAKGAVVATLGTPQATDSKRDPHTGMDATGKVAYTLSTVGGMQQLTMTLDAAWLHDPARVFPVTADPNVSIAGQKQSTYVDLAFPSQNYLNYGGEWQYLKIGNDGAGDIDRPFLMYPTGVADTGYHITAAQFAAFDQHAWNSTSTYGYQVDLAGGAWSPSSITWGSQPTSIWGTAGTWSGSSRSMTCNAVAGRWEYTTLDPSLMSTVSRSSSFYGFELLAGSETNANYWKVLDSSQISSCSPYVSLTYTQDVAPQIDAGSMSPLSGFNSTTLTPTLSASGTDPDNWPGPLQYLFGVYPGSGGAALETSGWQSGTTWTVPDGTLTWGQSYQWSVAVYDGDAINDVGVSPTQFNTFTTAVPPPLLTSGLSQNTSGRGFDPQLGNYTTSATDAQVATVGPALSITRDYNSLDPRISQALGAGWSSILDARASQQYDASGDVASVTVTYPDGSEVGYGRNADGTFAAPLGRFATFTDLSGGGYTLTDKNDTVYTFAQSLGSGVYGLSSVADAAGRTLTATWASGQVTTLTSASGRALHMTWATPSGASFAHVATIFTDPVSGTDQGTDLVWKYFYSGDRLASVCDPVQSGACTGAVSDKSTKYTYTSGSQYRTAVLDGGPSGYWPLSEPSYGTDGIATDQVLSNEHGMDAAYTTTGVTYSVAGPLSGSSSTGVTLDGSSGAVTLPKNPVGANTYVSVSLWFKTTSSGVLFATGNDPVGTSSPGEGMPVLYVGTDGHLYGHFEDGVVAGIKSAGTVNDGVWHQAVLSGASTTQTLYLDGAAVGSQSAQISDADQDTYAFVGDGVLNSVAWPATPSHSSHVWWHLTGSVSDVAVYSGALSGAAAAGLHTAGTRATSLLTKVARPTGAVASQASYSTLTGRVTQVTDAFGGVWQVGVPGVSGSAEGYRAAVMASAPSGYWRLGDAAGSSTAYDEVNSDGGAMTYDNVTLGADGPLTGSQSAATFDGDSSQVATSGVVLDTTKSFTVSAWANLSSAASWGNLLSQDAGVNSGFELQYNLGFGTWAFSRALSDSPGSGAVQVHGSDAPSTDTWYHLVGVFDASDGDDTMTLYVNGVVAGTDTDSTPYASTGPLRIGAGQDEGDVSAFFPGSVADVAVFPSALSGADVSALYAAGKNTMGLNPTETVAVNDPDNHPLGFEYDPANGSRMIAQSDATGAKTTYGYDTGGFQHTVVDPDGNETITGHDPRGNQVSTTTCQVQSTNACSTQYFSYYPAGDTDAMLTSADPRNDMMLTSSDARSSAADDPTYQTTFDYDALGDRTSVTTPPVPGYPAGRTAVTSYSDGTSAYPAADGGAVPAGLPVKAVSAGGAVTLTSYFHTGDVAATRSPDGLVTRYSYDQIGRVAAKTTSPGSPTAWWPLNQSAGASVADATVDGNTATASAVTWSGGAGVFNGTSSQITTATPVLNTAASFTLSAWVNLSKIPSSYADVLTLGGTFQDAASLLYSKDNGSWSFVTTSGDTQSNTSYAANASTAPSAGAWTHLVGVYDQAAGVDKLYVNNTLMATAAVAHAWSATHILTLGSGGASAYFPGSIANVQLYQRALPATDIAALYGAGYAGSTVSTPTPNGQSTSFGYDTLGRTVSTTTPASTDAVTGAVHTAHTAATFDPDGDATSSTVSDLTGGDAPRTTTMAYNALDQLASSTDPAGASTTYTYNALGLKASERNAAGDTTAYGYDNDGRLTYTTLKNYTGSPSGSQSAADLIEEARTYDPAGRLASVTDAMGYATLYTYTDNGLTATVTRCQQMTLAGDTPACTGGSFTEQSNTYDGAGNQTRQVTNNDTTETDYTYDAAGRQATTTLDPDGLDRTTSKSFTADDFVASQTTGDNNGSATTDYTYTPAGVATSQSVENYTTGAPSGWWKLNDGAPGATTPSTARDWSGQNNTATLTSAAWASQAASFDGASSLASAAGPVLDTTASYSISAWVNLASTTQDSQTIVGQSAADGGNVYLEYSPTFGGWSFILRKADNTAGGLSAYDYASTSTGVAANTWTHVTGVYNASSGAMQLYVNGALAATATDSTPWPADGVTSIGAVTYADSTVNYTDGQIANVQVYPRALSASDVSNLHGAGRLGTALSTPTNTTSWQTDQRGLATAITDANGNTTHYTYDAAGHQVQTIAPTVSAGTYSTATGTYSAANVVPVSSTGYDTFGEVAETTDPDGNTAVTNYDADGRAVASTAASYTQPGAVNHATIAAARSVTQYNTLGEASKSWDAAGTESDYIYDQLGHQTSTTLDPGGLSRTTSTQYDPDGDALASTDPTGAISSQVLDYLGRPLSTTRVLGVGGSGSTQMPAGCHPNPQGTQSACTTTYAYQDTAGFLSQTSSASTPPVTETFGYDAAGERTRASDDLGDTTSTTYDFAGRPVKTTLPDNSYATTAYNAAGQQSSASQYSPTGTLLATSSATYDGDGNILSTTDPNANALIAHGAAGYSTTYTYDATGLATSETQPVTATSAITTSFGYDAAGNQTRYVTGNHNTWYTTYNSWGLPEAQIEPATATYTTPGASTFTTVYDADRRPIEQDSPGAVSTQRSYDSASELLTASGTSTNTGVDAPTATRTFTYYGNGLLKTAATSNTATSGSNATSETFAYDDSGELTSATGSAGTSAFTYTADGQMASRTDTVTGAAHTTGYGYDGAGRLSALSDALSGTTLTYSYNSLDQITRIGYGAGADTRTFTYSPAHLLSGDALATAANPSTPIASIGYGYDSDGNETSKTTTGFTGAGANTYSYDDAGRLTSWTNGSTLTAYSYDADGNRTQAGANVFTYDARDQLTGDGTTSYTYTARGTAQNATAAATGTLTTTADAYNQVQSDGADSYTYDALGRVIASGATALAYTGQGNTLSYDGAATFARDPAGALVASAHGGSSQLAFTDRHSDNVASFTASGTALSGSTAYDPLGKVISKTGYQTSLGYQSAYTSAATGKSDMAARWYNPATGQFTSKDTQANSPLPDSANANPFAYANDNPLTGTDPTGHCAHADGDFCMDAGANASDQASIGNTTALHSRASYVAYGHYLQNLARTYQAAKSNYDYWFTPTRNELIYPQMIDDGQCTEGSHCGVSIRARDAESDLTLDQLDSMEHGLINNGLISIGLGTLAAIPCVVITVWWLAAGCGGAITGGVSEGAEKGLDCSDGYDTRCSLKDYAEAIGVSAGLGAAISVLVAVGGEIAGRVLSKITGAADVDGAVAVGIDETPAVDDTLNGDIADLQAQANADISGEAMPKTPPQKTGGGDPGGSKGAPPSSQDTAGASPGTTPTTPEIRAAAPSKVEPEAPETPTEDTDAPGCAVPPPTHSFTGATPVLMADGTTAPIDQIKAGDHIANSVPGQNATQDNTVTDVIVTTTDRDFVSVSITPLTADPTSTQSADAESHRQAHTAAAATPALAKRAADAPAPGPPAAGAPPRAGQRGGTLTTTFHHPFYDITQAAFIDAQSLKTGDTLQTPTGRALVTAVRLYHADTTTYDLTVGALHTYYVVAGTTPVLVHNDLCGPRFEVSPGGEIRDLRPYQNQEPEFKELDLKEVEDAGVAPAEPGTPEFDRYIKAGRIRFAVLLDDRLVALPDVIDGTDPEDPDTIQSTHGALTGDVSPEDDYVQTAGMARISGSAGAYRGHTLNDYSGHFRPWGTASINLARETFSAYGIEFPDAGVSYRTVPDPRWFGR